MWNSTLLKSVSKTTVFPIILSLVYVTSPITSIAANEFKATSSDFTVAAKKAIPAVVSIKAHLKDKRYVDEGSDTGDSQFFNDDFWNRFFGVPYDKKVPNTPQIGQGSGFIVSSDGYILTNDHITHDAAKLLVTLNDGREFPAKIIGQDPNTDVSVIKIDAKDLPFLKLGNSSDIEVGQWAIAVGNPLGLQATLTVGVISAKDRSNLGLAPYEDYIQTDAAINLGNSGGPLLNMEGDVIGINSAIATKTGGYMGIGFAIPSNIAKHVMEQLIEDGTVTRGYLGVVLQNIDSDLAAAFNLDKIQGALVAEVAKESSAEKSGLKQGDIILKYNGKPVESITLFRNAVAMMKPGTPLVLSIKRDHQYLDIKIDVGTLAESHAALTQEDSKANKLGIQVEELKSEGGQNPSQKGVVVVKIEAGSLASWAGIRKGSIIISVNQEEVSKPDQFYKAINNTPAGKPILLLIRQGTTTRFVSLKAE